MGHSLKRAHCKGNLVSSRKQIAHNKSPGTKSGLSGLKRVPRPLFKQHSPGSHRQHNSGCLYQQRRGDEVCPTVENFVLVHQETGNPQGTSHPRLAERDSRQAIQTWPDHSEVFKAICSRWHQPQVDMFATRFNNKLPQFVSPVPDPQGSGCTQPVTGKSGPIRLSTSSHLGQSGGEVAGLPLQQDYSDFPGWSNMPWFWDLVAISSQIPLCLPNLPNLVPQPFNQTLHRNLSNLNLHAWLLEPQQSRSRGSLRQWQHELRLLREDQPVLSMR